MEALQAMADELRSSNSKLEKSKKRLQEEVYTCNVLSPSLLGTSDIETHVDRRPGQGHFLKFTATQIYGGDVPAVLNFITLQGVCEICLPVCPHEVFLKINYKFMTGLYFVARGFEFNS